jgi:NAD(P)-dependent dehydrogenase (short-subunit alcohol dehydrogenase family)
MANPSNHLLPGRKGELLRDKVALVTGASRGIGKAVAEALVQEGARVAAMARSRCGVDGALALQGDVGNPEDVERAFAETERQLGAVDILVNNAAVLGPPQHVAEVDPAAWAETYRVNVQGTMLCAHRALARMIERRSGKIINVSSGAALVPIAGYTAYSSSKAAVLHFSVCLAEEVKPYGINVNCVGVWAHTAMWDEQLRGAPMPAVADAAGRGQRPLVEDNMDAILFLASPASDHVTGQYLATNSLPSYVRR